jgi:hypothetical protein
MTETDKIIEQTKIAFDFLQRLYSEVAYLIKEIEGHLSNENFIIGKPSGYGITARSSTGLESNNVQLWLLRKLSVFFIEREKTKIQRGQTRTDFSNDLKILYIRIILNNNQEDIPNILYGVQYNIKKKTTKSKWPNYYEHLMGAFEYNEKKMFQQLPNGHYSDSYVEFDYKYMTCPLFELNNSENVQKKIIDPLLEIYKGC